MADEKEEKAYEVKDKRRVNSDGSLKEDAEVSPEELVEEEPIETPVNEQAAEPEAEEKAESPSSEAEMPMPNVYETLQFITGLLAEQAWQFMGLHMPPGRKELVRDMVQAKLAIDTVIFVSDKLHPHLSEDDRKAIRVVVSDLQLNFVQQNK